MPGQLHTIMLKAKLPTVTEARATLIAEIDKARAAGATAIKVIHGYGSSGRGGELRPAIRRSLRKRKKEGRIQLFVTGEAWDVCEPDTQQIIDACPALRRDRDLGRHNEGVTFVLL